MRLVSFAAAAAAPLLLLAACSPPAPAPGPAPGPDPAPAATLVGTLDLSQPFTVRGTEPFWAIAVTPATLDYSGLDRPQQTAANPGPVMSGTTATYTVTTSLNNSLVITLTPDATCSDGMSDTVYPAAATVVIAGETLTGCAGA